MSQTYIPIALRSKVARQARHRCGYCLSRETVTGLPLQIDHLVPEALGGKTEEENLWLACTTCNGHKSLKTAGLDPVTGAIVGLYNPRQ